MKKPSKKTYSIKEAEKNGTLIPLSLMFDKWKGGPISHITKGIYEKFATNNEVSLSLLNDFFNQIMKKVTQNLKENGKNNLWKLNLKDKDGNNFNIFVLVNEREKLTIMLLKEY